MNCCQIILVYVPVYYMRDPLNVTEYKLYVGPS